VSETKARLLAAVAPNLTAVTPVNPHPLIVTLVPPEIEPSTGLTEVTVGAPPAPRVQVAKGPTVNDHVYATVLTVTATV
jgi:hypothetical protein